MALTWPFLFGCHRFGCLGQGPGMLAPLATLPFAVHVSNKWSKFQGISLYLYQVNLSGLGLDLCLAFIFCAYHINPFNSQNNFRK